MVRTYFEYKGPKRGGWRALYLEPGVEPEEEFVAGVAAAMRDFLIFHEANDLLVERSEPAAFGSKLSAAL